MTAICITGTDAAALNVAAQMLQAAGMGAARPTDQGRITSIEGWHSQILASLGHDPQALQAPGRLWERLAVDLFVANMEQPCWGWASTDSLPLLGFWAGFEPQTRFVLVCETLEQVVARHLAQQRPAQDLDAVIARWHQGHESMLRFHLRHSQVSQLVWGHTLQAHGADHLTKWQAQWGLPLALGNTPTEAPAQEADTGPTNALLAHLAQRILQAHPDSQALADELAACIPTMGDAGAESVSASAAPELASLVAGMQALRSDAAAQAMLEAQERSQATLAQALEQAHKQSADELARHQQTGAQQIAAQKEASDLLSAQLQQVRQELGKQTKNKDSLQAERDKLDSDKAALTKERDGLTADLARRQQTFDQQIAEQKEESDLLLEQLHQVQEELERTFLSGADLKSKLDALTKTKEALQAERDKLAAEKTALTKERDQLNADKASLTQQRDVEVKAKQARQAERDKLAAEKTAVTKERDQLSADKASLTQQRDVEVKAKQALQAERDKLASEKAAWVKERDTLAKDHEKAKAAQKEASEENDLLLQQLHQVQEELERHFLDNQSTQLRLQQMEASTSRVMASFPGAFDCEGLEFVSGGAPATPWRWRAKGLGVAGHRLEQLEFETVMEQGVTGIALKRDKGQPSPLLRWPLSARDADSTLLMPLPTEQNGNRHMALLAQLSSSDWDMTQALLQLIIRHLAQHTLSVPAEGQNTVLQSVAKTRALMRQLDDVLRFDGATLAAQQAAANREVLSLKLSHLSQRNIRLADFGFQLQAQPQPAATGDKLGGTVHLIFTREVAAAPFESWGANAKDGGSRPVMAIPLSERGPMATVWERLTLRDRAFVTSLVDTLPMALALLQGQGTKLQRNWKEWIELATAMRQWVRLAPSHEAETPVLTLISKDAPVAAKRPRKVPAPSVSKPAIKKAATKEPRRPAAAPVAKAPAAKKATVKSRLPVTQATARGARAPVRARAAK